MASFPSFHNVGAYLLARISIRGNVCVVCVCVWCARAHGVATVSTCTWGGYGQ